MIDHPAFPEEWPDWECRNAAELAFRELVRWLEKHNMEGTPEVCRSCQGKGSIEVSDK